MFRTADEAEDELFDALRAERPLVPDEQCRPDYTLLEALVRPRRRHRRVAVVATAAAVAAVLVVTGQVGIDDEGGGVTLSGPPRAAADIAHIVATSQAALASSGRALLDFHVGRGTMAEQRITGTVAFSGDDVDMVLAFGPDATGRGPGFEARNRTVDGQFYLYDAGRWVRDTNASDVRGSDMFNADPRMLLAALHPAAGFEVVGTEVVDGAVVRHLRATRLVELPTLNVSFGPIDPKELETLDLWVGPDDIVRRLDIGTLQLSTHDPDPELVPVPGTDGKKLRATESPDPARAVTTEIRSTYSLRFTDIGAPIDITAPKEARDVAGQG